MHLEIETASMCNRHCVSCLRNTLPRPTVEPWHSKVYMPLNIIHNIIDESIQDLGIQSICFSHYNEPLLDERLPQIIKSVKQKYPSVYTFFHTNGDFFTAEVASLLNGIVDRIAFTLYTNDAIAEERYQVIESLLPDTLVTRMASKHIPVHFSPIHPWEDLSRQYRNEPCSQPQRRLIFNHKAELLLCCEDVTGHFNLGSYPHKSVNQLYNSEVRNKILDTLSKPLGRKQYDYCYICPWPYVKEE